MFSFNASICVVLINSMKYPLSLKIRFICNFFTSHWSHFYTIIISLESIVSKSVNGLTLVSRKMGEDSKYDNKEIWNILDKKSKFALSRREVRSVMNIQCKLSLNFKHIQDVNFNFFINQIVDVRTKTKIYR
ncbi:hypothetical protein QTP88_014411 [Uroleucon formosanum]